MRGRRRRHRRDGVGSTSSRNDALPLLLLFWFLGVPATLSLAPAAGPRPAVPASDALPPAFDALPQDRIDAFREDLEALRDRLDIPGLSVAIARDGEAVWAGGLGWADIESRRPATPETPYRIASISKTMTAAVLLGLASEGRLDLDAPVSRYLEGGAEAGAGEDAEGGLRGGAPAAGGDRAEPGPARPWTRRATVRQVLTHTSEGPRPGEIYAYSGRYDVLSRVAAVAAGRPFPALLFERVFRPASTSRTVPISLATTDRGEEILADLAIPYGPDGAPAEPEGTLPSETLGGNGVISTVLDLVRFVDALEDGRLVSGEAREAMWTPTRTSDGEVLPYGMGWFVEATPTLELVRHGGQWPVYSGLLLHLRRGGGPTLTLAILTNSSALSRPFWDIGTGTVLHSPAAASFLRRFALNDVRGGEPPELPWGADAAALEARGRALGGQAARYHYGTELFGRGLTARAAGDPARADSLLRAAVACCPTALRASTDLGLLFHLGRSGDPELRRLGREAGRRRLERAPGDPLARFHLAVSHVQGGDGARAIPLLESLVEGGREPESARDSTSPEGAEGAGGAGTGGAGEGADPGRGGWGEIPAWIWGWSAYLLAEETAAEDPNRAVSLLERILALGVDEDGLLAEAESLLEEIR